MPASKVAVFGATGDCAGYTLSHLLNNGYDCVALARTPANLTKSMKDKGVSADNIDRHLTIVQGSVKDVEAVKSALQINGQVVDKIMSGIGSAPALQWSIFRPVILKDPTICQDAGRVILQALTELRPAKKPFFINVSTTGIPPKGMPRDVPLLFAPLYHWLLIAPHLDKGVLQENLVEHAKLPEAQRAIRGHVNVKASLLMDGPVVGLEKVRQGIDERPAIGYTIRRSDVGLWVFEKLMKAEPKNEWLNKSVTITY